MKGDSKKLVDIYTRQMQGLDTSPYRILVNQSKYLDVYSMGVEDITMEEFGISNIDHEQFNLKTIKDSFQKPEFHSFEVDNLILIYPLRLTFFVGTIEYHLNVKHNNCIFKLGQKKYYETINEHNCVWCLDDVG